MAVPDDRPKRRGDPGGEFRPLWSFDAADYLAHLRRLSPEDRRSRFQAEVSDTALEDHVAEALRGRSRVIGWWHDSQLRGAAEVWLSKDGASAEGAFEVEERFRGRGVGSSLVGAALLWARNRGARRLVIHTSRRNVPMLRAAAHYDAAFEFDLSEVEGAIRAHAPTMLSHAEEALAIEAAFVRVVLRRSADLFQRLTLGSAVWRGVPSVKPQEAGTEPRG